MVQKNLAQVESGQIFQKQIVHSEEFIFTLLCTFIAQIQIANGHKSLLIKSI